MVLPSTVALYVCGSTHIEFAGKLAFTGNTEATPNSIKATKASDTIFLCVISPFSFLFSSILISLWQIKNFLE
jgi:hypothetical protein